MAKQSIVTFTGMEITAARQREMRQSSQTCYIEQSFSARQYGEAPSHVFSVRSGLCAS
jgi:hypothetical protein